MLLMLTLWAVPTHAGEERRNWHNDPFFQISSGMPECPMPRGPHTTKTQMLAEAHHRAERGTSCWLAGKCDRPTSYQYDRDIATSFMAAIKQNNPFADTALWVTVQGRVVYIEGCAGDAGVGQRVEAFAMSLPYVDMAVANIRWDAALPPPYPQMNDE